MQALLEDAISAFSGFRKSRNDDYILASFVLYNMLYALRSQREMSESDLDRLDALSRSLLRTVNKAFGKQMEGIDVKFHVLLHVREWITWHGTALTTKPTEHAHLRIKQLFTTTNKKYDSAPRQVLQKVAKQLHSLHIAFRALRETGAILTDEAKHFITFVTNACRGNYTAHPKGRLGYSVPSNPQRTLLRNCPSKIKQVLPRPLLSNQMVTIYKSITPGQVGYPRCRKGDIVYVKSEPCWRLALLGHIFTTGSNQSAQALVSYLPFVLQTRNDLYLGRPLVKYLEKKKQWSCVPVQDIIKRVRLVPLFTDTTAQTDTFLVAGTIRRSRYFRSYSLAQLPLHYTALLRKLPLRHHKPNIR
jgi:hypothetical protein